MVVDLHQEPPAYEIQIDRVGVKNVKKRLFIHRRTSYQLFVTLNIYTKLSEKLRGVNMSRFLEVLDDVPCHAGSLEEYVINVAQEAKKRHKSDCCVEAFSMFPYEIVRPNGKIEERIFPLEVAYSTHNRTIIMTVTAEGASACPCSLSNSGIPHMQRVYVKLSVELNANKTIKAGRLVDTIYRAVSTPTYSTLKRDEEAEMLRKMKPKFSEDIIREIVAEVNNNDVYKDIKRYFVEIESYESIHPHNIYSCCKGKRTQKTR